MLYRQETTFSHKITIISMSRPSLASFENQSATQSEIIADCAIISSDCAPTGLAKCAVHVPVLYTSHPLCVATFIYAQTYVPYPVRVCHPCMCIQPPTVTANILSCLYPTRILPPDQPTTGPTRSAQIFYHQACSTNYEMNSVVPRLHRLGNLVSSNFDFFNGSNRQLKLVFYKK
jgi:hypothetical protein